MATIQPLTLVAGICNEMKNEGEKNMQVYIHFHVQTSLRRLKIIGPINILISLRVYRMGTPAEWLIVETVFLLSFFFFSAGKPVNRPSVPAYHAYIIQTNITKRHINGLQEENILAFGNITLMKCLRIRRDRKISKRFCTRIFNDLISDRHATPSRLVSLFRRMRGSHSRL